MSEKTMEDDREPDIRVQFELYDGVWEFHVWTGGNYRGCNTGDSLEGVFASARNLLDRTDQRHHLTNPDIQASGG